MNMLIRGFLWALVLGNLLFFLWYDLSVQPSSLGFEPESKPKKEKEESVIENRKNEPTSRELRTYELKNDSGKLSKEEEWRGRQDRLNCHVPVGYPKGPPKLKRLTKICNNLLLFSISCVITDKRKCDQCVPPNGEEDWANAMTKRFQEGEQRTRQERRRELEQIIQNRLTLSSIEDEGIVIFTINAGYTYLFMNWVCGLEALHIAENIRSTTIVVATDEESEQLVRLMGFQVVRGDWLDIKIPKEAAEEFALGAHRFVVALQIVYTFDLIDMGYNVLQQDTDIVWLKDVRSYFYDTFDDVEMPCDGRVDNVGPGNSGFIHIRSNCKTR
ncbi:hypothetical protein RFI_05658, partial [Reticulomyxa filosa]